MLYTGLVSITFRKLKVEEIINLVLKGKLEGIEWGGDIHVPHGDVKKAREVRKMTVENGLTVAAYGSYYKVGTEDNNLDEFKRVLDSAIALHAPVIRVWAGDKATKDASHDWWEKVIENSRSIAEEAKKAGIQLSYEYHSGTLTDNINDAVKLYESIKHENIKAYWQPSQLKSFEQNKNELIALRPILTNVHAFNWKLDGDGKLQRYPLSDGITEWSEYLKHISGDMDPHYVMLEFVKNDDPEQFLKDAQVLHKLIR
jgi:sugar phosphate isomerase/epimerase